MKASQKCKTYNSKLTRKDYADDYDNDESRSEYTDKYVQRRSLNVSRV